MVKVGDTFRLTRSWSIDSQRFVGSMATVHQIVMSSPQWVTFKWENVRAQEYYGGGQFSPQNIKNYFELVGGPW